MKKVIISCLLFTACSPQIDNGFYSADNPMFNTIYHSAFGCTEVSYGNDLPPDFWSYPDQEQEKFGFPIDIRIINGDKDLEPFLVEAMFTWNKATGKQLFKFSGVVQTTGNGDVGISVQFLEPGQEFPVGPRNKKENILGVSCPINFYDETCHFYSSLIIVRPNHKDLVPVLIHEIGHSFGLTHDDYSDSIMNKSAADGQEITDNDAELIRNHWL